MQNLRPAPSFPVRMTEGKGEVIEIFGKSVRLPEKSVYLSGFMPDIQGDVAKISEGDLFTVILKPQEDHSVTFAYDGPAET